MTKLTQGTSCVDINNNCDSCARVTDREVKEADIE